MERPGLNAALSLIKPGQTLVVWRLDRLGRSLSNLIKFIDQLGDKSIGFQSLSEAIDTNSSSGILVFHIMAALAEFERNLISDRTKAGLSAAKLRGQRLGRPQSLSEVDIQAAWAKMSSKKYCISDAAAEYGVSPRTLRRYFKALEIKG